MFNRECLFNGIVEDMEINEENYAFGVGKRVLPEMIWVKLSGANKKDYTQYVYLALSEYQRIGAGSKKMLAALVERNVREFLNVYYGMEFTPKPLPIKKIGEEKIESKRNKPSLLNKYLGGEGK